MTLRKETARTTPCEHTLVEINPTLMSINTRQPPENIRTREGGAPCPEALGLVEYAENLRYYDNQLRPVALPETLCSTPYTPVGVEQRGRLTHILTQNSSNQLRHSFSIDARGHVYNEEKIIGTTGKRVIETRRAGRFTILRMEDNSIQYLRYDSDAETYILLGGLPDFPRLTVERIDQPSVSAVCPSVTINPPVADFRRGVTKKLTALLDKSVREALRDAEKTAKNAGVWTSPIAVRLGIRLWDGNLIHVSEPRIILPPTADSDNVDALYTLVREGTSFAETGTATLSLPAFRIKVGMEGITPGFLSGWGGLIRQIEIRVTDPLDTFASSGATAAYRFTDDGTDTLRVRLDRLDSAGTVATLADADTSIHSLIPLSEMNIGHTLERRRPRIKASLHPKTSLMPGYASVLSTHDGFLHLSGISRRLPEIPVPECEQSGSAARNVTLSVSIRIDGIVRTLTRQTTMKSFIAGPLLWYPDKRAESFTITFTSQAGVPHTATFPLTPCADEDAAYYAEPNGHPINLEERATAGVSAPSGEAILFEREPESVCTSLKSNPFIRADRAESVGGEVCAITGQPNVDGTYTRHLLYCFTDNGVTALMHDYNGRHRNLRHVSALKVTSADSVTSGKSAVYALSGGELVRFSDARATTLLKGVSEFERIFWHDAWLELWLIPAEEEGKSLALDLWKTTETAIAGSMRSVEVGKILHCGRRVLLLKSEGSLNSIYQPEGEGTGLSEIAWRSSPLHFCGQKYSKVRVELIPAREARAGLMVEARNPYSDDISPETQRGVVLAYAGIAGASHRTVELPFATVPPSLVPADAATLSVSIGGHIRSLRKVSLLGTF